MEWLPKELVSNHWLLIPARVLIPPGLNSEVLRVWLLPSKMPSCATVVQAVAEGARAAKQLDAYLATDKHG